MMLNRARNLVGSDRVAIQAVTSGTKAEAVNDKNFCHHLSSKHANVIAVIGRISQERDFPLNKNYLSCILWTFSDSQGSNNQLGKRCTFHKDTTQAPQLHWWHHSICYKGVCQWMASATYVVPPTTLTSFAALVAQHHLSRHQCSWNQDCWLHGFCSSCEIALKIHYFWLGDRLFSFLIIFIFSPEQLLLFWI